MVTGDSCIHCFETTQKVEVLRAYTEHLTDDDISHLKKHNIKAYRCLCKTPGKH